MANTTFIYKGHTFTAQQLKRALDASMLLYLAYAKADADNGGFESVSWSDIDDAYEKAFEALPVDLTDNLNQQAKKHNEE